MQKARVKYGKKTTGMFREEYPGRYDDSGVNSDAK